MKRVFAVLLSMIVSAGVLAADGFPDPFGLSWGMSEAQLKGLGFVRTSNSDGELHLLTSNNAPKPWSQAETYVAVTYKDHLVKVIAASKDFTSDITGSDGKLAYKKLNDIIQEKYGRPKDHLELSGQELFKDYDEFYQCLKYPGCGAYMSSYSVAGGTIGVELLGESRGTGYLRLSYESPEFARALSEIKSKTSASDADAL